MLDTFRQNRPRPCDDEAAPSARKWVSTLLAAASLAFVGFDCTADSGARRDLPSTTAERSDGSAEPSTLSRSQPLMGTTFRIDVRTTATGPASEAIAAAFREVDRVEHLISGWESSSELSKVNRLAGKRPAEVGPELLGLMRKAKRISRQTDGAFDVTFAGCGSLWSFRAQKVPSQKELRRCRDKVGWERIEIAPEASTVYLPDGSMEIGVGGIGKGYGVDRAAAILEENDVDTYMIDGGGDVRVRTAPEARPWRIGIAHPRQNDRLLGQLRIREGAVVTSGDYERFFRRDGKRYHHILDPETARPARKSVATTVLADEAADADALATGLFVMGPSAGIDLAERLSDVDALVVGPDLTLHMTSGFEKRFVATTRPNP